MADNVAITQGTGTTIAADDVGGVLYQRVKLGIGADGAAADLAFGQGAKAASLPVTLASDDDLHAKVGAVTETAPATDTASSGLNGRLQRIAQRLTSILAGVIIAAGENFIGSVGGRTATVSATFARVADTNAYAVGDLIADSTTAATVNANVTAGTAGIMVLAVARAADKTGMVRRLRLKTNDTAFAAATVRVHLFKDRPTVTNGDNGAFLTTESSYLGYSDIAIDRHFSDAEKGIGAPSVGGEWNFEPSSGTANIFALLEARSVVTPGSAKTWTLTAEVLQN